ncbi:MAG TPA: PDZ domain-containing protein, partial [Epsilonproteobacteria bacterium]|nr:PDZ domain-containing protein [Campylobacterota bacterium]
MLYKTQNFLCAVMLALLLAGCGKSTPSNTFIPQTSIPSGLFSENEKSYLYDLFLTEYYWYEHVPQPFDYSAYTSPQPMIDDLKYSALDRWSFALTRQDYDNFSIQRTSGFGFGYTDDLTVYLVRLGSPAEAAGLLRGDKIVSINGQTATEERLLQASAALGQQTRFTVDRFGTLIDIYITAQAYSYRVVDLKILQTNAGHTVAYLRLDSFTDSAVDELESAFTSIKNQRINKLVIDLRYNPGGLLNTASIFMDKIGRDYNGKVQCSLEWNDQNSGQNETLLFDSLDPNSLSPSKLIFLTSEESASASELVINGMKPYMQDDVVIVGETTHGKPVGMSGRTNGSYVYFLINFVIKNADGFYDYFNGLAPDCSVADDDYWHQLGDPDEAL